MIVFCSPATNYPKLTMIRVEAVILYATDMVSEVLIKLKRKIQLTSDWIKWMTLYWSYYFKALLMSFKTSWIVIREEQAPQPPLSQSHDFSAVSVTKLCILRKFVSLPSLHSKEILLAPKLKYSFKNKLICESRVSWCTLSRITPVKTNVLSN